MSQADVQPRQAADELTDPWLRWRGQRPPAESLYLDTAAAGRSSIATLRASAAHAEREAACGAYVAETAAQPVLEAGRADLAQLLSVPVEGVAYVESAEAALEALLSSWPLRSGDTVAVASSEWGPNLAAFAHHDLRIVELATLSDGSIDLEALATFLAAAPPAFVHLTQVASHRPIVQPVAEAAALCRAAQVPLWVDVAQALGHVDTATGADVQYSTGRKWLTGPRGAGVVAVSDRWWDVLHVHASPLARAALTEGTPAVRLLEWREANVAARVGLCTAVREYLDTGPAQIWQRLADVGALTSEALSDLPGWAVIEPAGAPCAITALRPTAGQNVPTSRARLLTEHGIVTTAEATVRAPDDMPEPLLRISPHVDCTPAELTHLRTALQSLA